MKLTVNAEVLKNLVSKSVKGVGNDKLVPITSLMGIACENGLLTITTTDGTNYLFVTYPLNNEDFYVVVNADMFAKLVAKLTCDVVVLELIDNSLEIRGNGKYHLELPLDENGTLVTYPNPMKKFMNANNLKTTTIDCATIKTILESVKPSLATSIDDAPCYMHYYVGTEVLATDTYKIASLPVTLFDTPLLISSTMMDLLSLVSEDAVTVWYDENEIVFKSSDITIYGKLPIGVEDYAFNEIHNLVVSEFDSMCKVSRSQLLELLDRLMLFVGTYDYNGVLLNFGENELSVTSKSSSGTETLKYLSSDNPTEFTCMVDIKMLYSQVKAYATDDVEIWYGRDNAIKLLGTTTQIISLMEL